MSDIDALAGADAAQMIEHGWIVICDDEYAAISVEMPASPSESRG